MTRVAVTALTALYHFILSVSRKVSAFPRTSRFTVGDRLLTALLDVLDRLIEHSSRRECGEDRSSGPIRRLSGRGISCDYRAT